MSLPRACTPSPALGAASGSSVLRQQDEQQKHKEELQRKVREVEVRAMQEVVELRKSLAAAHLDAQEQRRLYASLREKPVHDERNMRTPAAQEAAVCAAREAAERASEVALAAQLEQQLAAREAAVAAIRHEAEAHAARQLGAAHAAAAAAAASEAARRDEEVRTIRAQLDQCQRLYAASEATAAERLRLLEAAETAGREALEKAHAQCKQREEAHASAARQREEALSFGAVERERAAVERAVLATETKAAREAAAAEAAAAHAPPPPAPPKVPRRTAALSQPLSQPPRTRRRPK